MQGLRLCSLRVERRVIAQAVQRKGVRQGGGKGEARGGNTRIACALLIRNITTHDGAEMLHRNSLLSRSGR